MTVPCQTKHTPSNIVFTFKMKRQEVQKGVRSFYRRMPGVHLDSYVYTEGEISSNDRKLNLLQPS